MRKLNFFFFYFKACRSHQLACISCKLAQCGLFKVSVVYILPGNCLVFNCLPSLTLCLQQCDWPAAMWWGKWQNIFAYKNITLKMQKFYIKYCRHRFLENVKSYNCLVLCSEITKDGTSRPSSLWGSCVSLGHWRPSRGFLNSRSGLAGKTGNNVFCNCLCLRVCRFVSKILSEPL